MKPKILVIRGGAIGDFVLTLPAIKLLRENFPQAHLELLGYPHILALAEGRFYADAIRSIEYSAMAGFFIPGSELDPELVAYFSGFQQIVSYLYDPDYFFESNLRRCGVKNFLSISSVLNEFSHASHQLARPLERLALYLEDPQARIYPSEADRQFATEFLQLTGRPIIAIHPGSGSARKNWPVGLWTELAQWLLALPAQPVLLLIGGEADQEALFTLKQGLPPDSIRLAHNLKLPHLAALLKSSSLFLGHDSGISHIAAAVNTRCVLMYGPTNPSVWAPVGAHIHLIHAQGGEMRRIGLKQMQDAILKTEGW